MRRVAPWLWPLALMGLIFFLSAQPDLNSGLGVIDLIGRKLAHALLFGLLCAAWWRALSRAGLGVFGALATALAITLAYAVSDEFHQTFVHGRKGAPHDVAIDALGALVACGAIWRRRTVR